MHTVKRKVPKYFQNSSLTVFPFPFFIFLPETVILSGTAICGPFCFVLVVPSSFFLGRKKEKQKKLFGRKIIKKEKKKGWGQEGVDKGRD